MRLGWGDGTEERLLQTKLAKYFTKLNQHKKARLVHLKKQNDFQQVQDDLINSLHLINMNLTPTFFLSFYFNLNSQLILTAFSCTFSTASFAIKPAFNCTILYKIHHFIM